MRCWLAAACFGGAAAKRERVDAQPPQRPTVRMRVTTAAWFALTATALAFGAVAALAPEKEYDALWYHLNLPDCGSRQDGR